MQKLSLAKSEDNDLSSSFHMVFFDVDPFFYRLYTYACQACALHALHALRKDCMCVVVVVVAAAAVVVVVVVAFAFSTEEGVAGRPFSA